jgi:hypothetical protein
MHFVYLGKMAAHGWFLLKNGTWYIIIRFLLENLMRKTYIWLFSFILIICIDIFSNLLLGFCLNHQEKKILEPVNICEIVCVVNIGFVWSNSLHLINICQTAIFWICGFIDTHYYITMFTIQQGKTNKAKKKAILSHKLKYK